MTIDPIHPDAPLNGDATFAMCRLIERLMHEGYVYTERVPELFERVQNMEHGSGFLTNAELTFRKRRKPPTASTEAQDLLS